MKREVYVWLEDIKKSISEINDYLPVSLNYVEFEKDLRTRRAVERNIEIIGEALNCVFLRFRTPIPGLTGQLSCFNRTPCLADSGHLSCANRTLYSSLFFA